MAPPGTEFRPPGGNTESQYAQTQTQRLDLSDDDVQVAESSDRDERSADIKPSTFIRSGGGFGVPVSAVAESPQSGGGFRKFTSQFSYTGSPKRPLSGDNEDSRQVKMPRQSGPARALPVQDQMTLEDIQDFSMRQKVSSMLLILKASVRTCYEALVEKRGHHQDAMNLIVEREQRAARPAVARPVGRPVPVDLTQEDDSLPSLASLNAARRDVDKSKSIANKWSQVQPSSTKQAPGVPVRSITEKHSLTHQPRDAIIIPDDKPRAVGRKIKRPQAASPFSSPVKDSPVRPVPQRSNKKVVDEEDEDEEEADLEDDDDSSVLEETIDAVIGHKLLNFINTCSHAALTDLSGLDYETIDQILKGRPYKNLNHVREVTMPVEMKAKKGGTRTTYKKIGDRVVDVCEPMMVGYEAVDQLVSQCESISRPMAEDMKKWGLDAFGASESAGELELTDIESAHDSGIGTPSSSSQAEESPQKKSKQNFIKQPKSMNSAITMMGHQIVGLNWLSLLWEHGLSGILADDMGLGKTMQVIAYFTHLFETQKSSGPHLVVVPGSTIENWLREFKNFSPGLRVEPYYGSLKERPQRQLDIEDNLDDIHVIVTTYDMAMKRDDARFLRKKIQPVVCVWDEAHGLKNSQSQKYKELIKIPAKQRLMLTGTPLQNNLTELASLMAFLMPDVFASREEDLQAIFGHKAKVGMTKDTNHEGERSKLLSAERVSRARSMITPFILRRKKYQVLKELPKKTSNVELVKLEGDQLELYQSLENSYRNAVLRRQAQRDTQKTKAPAKKKNKDSDGLDLDILPIKNLTPAEREKAKEDLTGSILMSLRKAAIHPLLFRRYYDDPLLEKIVAAFMRTADKSIDYNREFVKQDLSVMTDFEVHRWLLGDEQPSAIRKFAMKGQPWLDKSAKVRQLIEMLKIHAKDGHKTLVFSQFTMVMDILESAFTAAKLAFYRLDGQTKMEQRQDLIDAFYAAPTTGKGACSVFMLSTGAGGQGINLACADRVVIFDSGFNPHQDLQAENRAHRLGQTREVVVTRLVSEGTIEEQIQKVGEMKVQLDEQVAGSGVTANPEMDEKVGKAEVEKQLLAKLEEKEKQPADNENQKQEPKGEDGETKNTNGTDDPEVNKDLAQAFADGLKHAGLDVKK